MDAIVAVYSDWGIGSGGTQPVVIKDDRRHFVELTRGAAVIAGRKTMEDFPGGRPLKGRFNVMLTHGDAAPEGVAVAHTPEEAIALTQEHERVFVLGGASVFRQMLPLTRRVYVTKLGVAPVSDVYFPNLDLSPEWRLTDPGTEQTEDGIPYRYCVYERVE